MLPPTSLLRRLAHASKVWEARLCAFWLRPPPCPIPSREGGWAKEPGGWQRSARAWLEPLRPRPIRCDDHEAPWAPPGQGSRHLAGLPKGLPAKAPALSSPPLSRKGTGGALGGSQYVITPGLNLSKSNIFTRMFRHCFENIRKKQQNSAPRIPNTKKHCALIPPSRFLGALLKHFVVLGDSSKLFVFCSP